MHLSGYSGELRVGDCTTGEGHSIQFYGRGDAKQEFSPDGQFFPCCQFPPGGDLPLIGKFVEFGGIVKVARHHCSIQRLDALTPISGEVGVFQTSWSGIMRALCLLALIGATLSGCCSTHRAWSDGYGSCVSPGDSCDPCGSSCGSSSHKSCLFGKKSSPCRCSHCGSACGDCGAFGGGCGSSCGADFGGCSSCGDGMVFDGMPSSSGCSSCAQGQMINQGSFCPTCQQNQMNQMSPTPAQSSSPGMAPPPPTPPASSASPMANAPEPTEARLMQPMYTQPQMRMLTMQPLQVQPVQTQPVQYQEWQQHQAASPQVYNPPAQMVPQPPQTAVQPVLWVPAQPQTQAPLTLPAQ